MIPEAGCSSRAELLGHEEMKASFELLIEGRGVKWDYHLRAATDTPKGKTPAQETLRVGFPTPLEKIDPSAGNVYVIDLTQASVRIKRLTIDLPTGFKPIEPKGKSVDSLLAPILSKIEQASPETFR